MMPPMPLLPCQRQKLVKVLGLTGSPHPGEVVAAAAAAHRILTAAGLTWDSVIAPAASDDDETATADAEIAWCLDHTAELTAWDRQFLVSLQSFTRLSEKQRAVLDRIIRKCQAAQRR